MLKFLVFSSLVSLASAACLKAPCPIDRDNDEIDFLKKQLMDDGLGLKKEMIKFRPRKNVRDRTNCVCVSPTNCPCDEPTFKKQLVVKEKEAEKEIDKRPTFDDIISAVSNTIGSLVDNAAKTLMDQVPNLNPKNLERYHVLSKALDDVDNNKFYDLAEPLLWKFVYSKTLRQKFIKEQTVNFGNDGQIDKFFKQLQDLDKNHPPPSK